VRAGRVGATWVEPVETRRIETKRLDRSALLSQKRLVSCGATVPRYTSPLALQISFDRLRTALKRRLPCNYRRIYARLCYPARRQQKRFLTGNDLLSQGVSPQVPSALEGLTSWFGMEQGVSPPLESPEEPYLAYGFKAAHHQLSAIQHPKN
jgi:hypothetical protein